MIFFIYTVLLLLRSEWVSIVVYAVLGIIYSDNDA